MNEYTVARIYTLKLSFTINIDYHRARLPVLYITGMLTVVCRLSALLSELQKRSRAIVAESRERCHYKKTAFQNTGQDMIECHTKVLPVVIILLLTKDCVTSNSPFGYMRMFTSDNL